MSPAALDKSAVAGGADILIPIDYQAPGGTETIGAADATGDAQNEILVRRRCSNGVRSAVLIEGAVAAEADILSTIDRQTSGGTETIDAAGPAEVAEIKRCIRRR